MNTTPRILIVEDDAVLVVGLQDMLRQMGYQIAGLVATGKAAVELALAQKPDAILMDIKLRGDMNGIQAAKQIHAQQATPVIYLTAYTDEILLQQAKATDAYAYLAKPVRERELRASVEMALYKHATEQRLQHLNQVLRAVRDVNQLITHERDAQRLIDAACQILVRTRGYRLVWFGQTTDDRLKPLAYAGDGQSLVDQMLSTGTLEQAHKMPGAEALRTGQTVICHDTLHDERYAPWRQAVEESQFRSTVAVPVCYDDSQFGVLIVHADQPHCFDNEEVDLLSELAGDIAFGLKAIARETERVRAEAERERLLAQVQAQAQQIAQIMDTVPEGVLLLDADGLVLLANPTGARDLATLAGVAVGEQFTHLGGLPLAELLASAERSGPWHELRAGRRSFEAIARPVAGRPATGHWVLVINDVTQARVLREQLQQQERLAAVGQMAAGIAHDFNNILAVIALDARLALAASDRVADVRARLATISGQAQRAADLVRQILDFSRQAVLERRPVALRPFLVEQIALLARTLPENITLELAGDDACTISADPTRLQQIVMNLAVNARDAMPAGGRLRFTLERVPALPSDLQPAAAAAGEAAEWVRLTVADSGTGIPPEVLPHIFEPFFTTKGPGKGSGLGLAQIHGIVKQHGGEIGVSTQAGVGTTFTIYLPALAASAVAEPVVVADEAPAAAGQTILIVEDDATLRDALVDTVDLLGYRTLSAANGREALTMLAQHREIALIMSDLGMPVMGGRALLQEVKQRGVTAPMVILSGHPLDDELTSLQALGLAGWLLKPPDPEQLARLLAHALPGR